MDEEIRKKILALLEQHRIMTIATLRPDGWPQATTVGYARTTASRFTFSVARTARMRRIHPVGESTCPLAPARIRRTGIGAGAVVPCAFGYVRGISEAARLDLMVQEVGLV